MRGSFAGHGMIRHTGGHQKLHKKNEVRIANNSATMTIPQNSREVTRFRSENAGGHDRWALWSTASKTNEQSIATKFTERTYKIERLHLIEACKISACSPNSFNNYDGKYFQYQSSTTSLQLPTAESLSAKWHCGE